jgi:hypothetical protein
MAPNFEYDQFPLAANNWGTTHPISDMAPPLQAEEEGPPKSKELILGMIPMITFPPSDRRRHEGFCHLSVYPGSLLDRGQGLGQRSSMPQGCQQWISIARPEAMGSGGSRCLA